MNKKIIVLSIFSAISFESQAQTVDLSVAGTIGNAGVCEVKSSNNGTYDFGDISSALVDKTNPVALGTPQTATWTVDCEATAYVTFSTSDLVKNTSTNTGNDYFGLGNVNTEGKIGHYRVLAKNPRVDDNDSYFFSTPSTSFSGQSERYLSHSWRSGWARKDNSSALASGKQFKVDLEVEAKLGSEADMKGAPPDGTQLAGHLTLTFKQGL